MDYTKSYFKTFSMSKYFTIDYLWGVLTVLFGIVASFVTPVASFILLMMVLVIVDLITGIKAARARGDYVTSRGLRRSIEKFFLYSCAILTSEGMRIVFMEAVPLTYITSLAICATEFKSNIENIEYVTKVKIWTFLKDKFKW